MAYTALVENMDSKEKRLFDGEIEGRAVSFGSRQLMALMRGESPSSRPERPGARKRSAASRRAV